MVLCGFKFDAPHLVFYFSDFMPTFLLAIGGLVIFAASVRTVYDIRHYYKGRKDTQIPKRRLSGKIVTRILAVSAALLALASAWSWQTVYFYRFSMALTFVWLCVTAIAFWAFSRFGRKGVLAVFVLHHVVLGALIVWAVLSLAGFTLRPWLLILLILSVNALILFRQKINALLVPKPLFWVALIFFGALVMGRYLEHPALRVLHSPPRFGAVTRVPGTDGLEIHDVLVSDSGNELYFTVKKVPEGCLGMMSAHSDKPNFAFMDLDSCGPLQKIPKIEAFVMGGTRQGKAKIEACAMDSFAPLGSYILLDQDIETTQIIDLDATDKRIYGTLNGPESAYMVVCPAPIKEHLEQGNLKSRCRLVELDGKRAGPISLPGIGNRVIVATTDKPTGPYSQFEQLLAFSMTPELAEAYDKGILTMAFKPYSLEFYVGRAYFAGIEVFNIKRMEHTQTLEGPKGINSLLVGENLLAGGSALEGELVIHHMKTKRYKRVFVGPGIGGMDFDEKNNIIYVGTQNGLFKVSLDLFFNLKMVW